MQLLEIEKLIFQVSKSILHLLVEISKVGSNLGFTVFDGILERKRGEISKGAALDLRLMSNEGFV